MGRGVSLTKGLGGRSGGTGDGLGVVREEEEDGGGKEERGILREDVLGEGIEPAELPAAPRGVGGGELIFCFDAALRLGGTSFVFVGTDSVSIEHWTAIEAVGGFFAAADE